MPDGGPHTTVGATSASGSYGMHNIPPEVQARLWQQAGTDAKKFYELAQQWIAQQNAVSSIAAATQSGWQQHSATIWRSPNGRVQELIRGADGQPTFKEWTEGDSADYWKANGLPVGSGNTMSSGGSTQRMASDDPRYWANLDRDYGEGVRQFDVTTAEGRRQFDTQFAQGIREEAARMGLEYDSLNQREKDSLRQLAYGYYNSTNDANASRQQALATLLTNKQNAATNIASVSGEQAKNAAEFAGNPRDAMSDNLYRNAIGGLSPYGSTDNAAFGELQTGLANRFTELFGGVGADLAKARQYLNQPIPQEYMTPITAPEIDYTPTQYTAPQVNPYQGVTDAYARDPNAANTFFTQKPEDLARFFGGAQQNPNPTARALTGLQAVAPQGGYTKEQIAALQKIAASYAKGGTVTLNNPNAAIANARVGRPTGQTYGTSTTSPYGIQPASPNVQYQRRADGRVQVVDSPVGRGNEGYTLNEGGRTRPIDAQMAQQLSAEAYKASIDRQVAGMGFGDYSAKQIAEGAPQRARTLLEANAVGGGLGLSGAGHLKPFTMEGYDIVNAVLNNPIAANHELRRRQQGFPPTLQLQGVSNEQLARALGTQALPTGGTTTSAALDNTVNQQALSASPGTASFTPARFAEGGQINLDSLFNSRDKPGYSPASSEGGTNMNLHERAIIVGESGQVYATLGEKRPDGSIRSEQLIIKPLKSEMKKDKELEEQNKQAVESQKKTLKAFASGGSVNTGDLLGQIRTRLRSLDPQAVAGPNQLLPDPRLLAAIYPQLGPSDRAYVQSGYSSQGISDDELDFTINRYRPKGLGYAPQVSYR